MAKVISIADEQNIVAKLRKYVDELTDQSILMKEAIDRITGQVEQTDWDDMALFDVKMDFGKLAASVLGMQQYVRLCEQELAQKLNKSPAHK